MSQEAAPDFKHLYGVERWTWLFAALVMGGAMVLAGPKGQLGATLGSCLMLANLWLMRRLGGRLYQALSSRSSSSSGGPGDSAGPGPGLGVMLGLLHLKLVGLAALIYVCIRYLPVDPLAFILGVSILPAAIVARAVQYGLSGPTAAENGAGNGES